MHYDKIIDVLEVINIYTQAQNKATQKYISKAYDDLRVRIPKGKKELLQQYCSDNNISINKLICDLLQEKTNIVMHKNS